MLKTRTTTDFALAYAALGWPVFPCAADKKPLVKRGFHEATCNAEQIRTWWRRWPSANIGIPTGGTFWVLDIDPRAGGLESFDALQAKGVAFETQQAKTGGGGLHLFFLADDRVRNSASKLGAGLDTRGDGGYVLAEPSVTSASYAFIDWDVFSGELPALARAPEWLIERVCKKQAPAANETGTPADLDRFSSGSRNAELTRIAGAMRRHGALEAGILAALREINLNQCAPPLEEEEVSRIAKSVARYASGAASSMSDVSAKAAEANGHSETADSLELVRNGKGAIVENEMNVVKILSDHESWQGKIQFDAFHRRTQTPSGREWSDTDDTKTLVWLQRNIGMHRIGIDCVRRAIDLVAKRNQVDAPADWLRSLQWDRVERITDFFRDLMGAESSEYTAQVSRAFWISMAARILSPGCQVDTMVVLEGEQGTGKSSALRIIGGQWYGELHESAGSKDAAISLLGKMLVEVSELNSFGRTEVTRIKQFVSCPHDRFRSPYDRRAEDLPRRCIMVGTTNEMEYLQDHTGGRRFLPVRCADIRLDLITENRDQFFSEAVVRFDRGEPWWGIEGAAEQQESRRQEDPWEELIAEFLVGKTQTTMGDIMKMLVLPSERQERKHMLRIGACMRVLGWTKRLLRTGHKVVKGWTKKDM